MNYFDTSALIKLFVDERGSERVSRLVRQARSVATAKIAYAEVYAGLARRRRSGDLSVAEYDRTRRLFELEWHGYIRLDLRDDILVLARDLTQRHPLRGFDAIHLASALNLRGTVHEEVTFVAADGRLVRAAEAERIASVDVRFDAAP